MIAVGQVEAQIKYTQLAFAITFEALKAKLIEIEICAQVLRVKELKDKNIELVTNSCRLL